MGGGGGVSHPRKCFLGAWGGGWGGELWGWGGGGGVHQL